MQTSHFYAMLSRMKYINRWGLMRNAKEESLSEHTLEVAMLAHALATLRNRRFGGTVDTGAVVLAALYHDASEILTGDLPTPIKYYNPKIRDAYKEIEAVSNQKILSMLPEDLQEDYQPFFHEQDEAITQLVKAADKLSALIKCIEEKKSGNREFVNAEQSITAALHAMQLPEITVFMQEFLPSFSLSLDELDG